jgi:hypothetical protein
MEILRALQRVGQDLERDSAPLSGCEFVNLSRYAKARLTTTSTLRFRRTVKSTISSRLETGRSSTTSRVLLKNG